MKRTLALMTAAVAAVIGLAAPASAASHPAAATTGKIEFTRIVYNPPGRDTVGKTNHEYVRLTNHSTAIYRMTGWTVSDAQHHVFTFPNGYRLLPGQVAIIHSGFGVTDKPRRGHLYRNGGYIWNNDAD